MSAPHLLAQRGRHRAHGVQREALEARQARVGVRRDTRGRRVQGLA
jgi:hypothetical protein